jgi:hypothetical protein
MTICFILWSFQVTFIDGSTRYRDIAVKKKLQKEQIGNDKGERGSGKIRDGKILLHNRKILLTQTSKKIEQQ